MKEREPDLFDTELPFQTHSRTSRAGARKPKRARIVAQEGWVYETIRASDTGLTDWQLWKLAEPTGLFDKLSSLHRARIGLVWVSRSRGATPYHPIANSGTERVDPESGVTCAVWSTKPLYRKMAYPRWVELYKALAHEERPKRKRK